MPSYSGGAEILFFCVFCSTAADIFFGPRSYCMVIRPSDEMLDYSFVQRRYATGKLRLCAYSVVTGFSHVASGGIFCAVSNGLIVLEPCLELDSAFATASQGSCDPPTQYPISPWPSACGGVGLHHFLMSRSTSSLCFLSSAGMAFFWSITALYLDARREVLYPHRYGCFWDGGLR